jgi:hypothetical protein
VIVLPLHAVHARDYEFQGRIFRPVLENYLSRSITTLDLLAGKGDVDDNIRMLRNMGAKFAGRSIYLWGGEGQLPQKLAAARQNAPKIHAADPDMILQACVFEIVSREVEQLPVPDRAFKAFGLSLAIRHSRDFGIPRLIQEVGMKSVAEVSSVCRIQTTSLPGITWE